MTLKHFDGIKMKELWLLLCRGAIKNMKKKHNFESLHVFDEGEFRCSGAAVCKITACHRTFSGEKHYVSVHVYICTELKL